MDNKNLYQSIMKKTNYLAQKDSYADMFKFYFSTSSAGIGTLTLGLFLGIYLTQNTLTEVMLNDWLYF